MSGELTVTAALPWITLIGAILGVIIQTARLTYFLGQMNEKLEQGNKDTKKNETDIEALKAKQASLVSYEQFAVFTANQDRQWQENNRALGQIEGRMGSKK